MFDMPLKSFRSLAAVSAVQFGTEWSQCRPSTPPRNKENTGTCWETLLWVDQKFALNTFKF